MTDKEFAHIRRRVHRLSKRWIVPIGLGQWIIHIEYFREPWEGASRPGDRDVCAMDCHVSWAYLEASIRINTQAVVGMDDEDLERCFVHELAHIFLREMRMSYDNTVQREEWASVEQMEHEERVATNLANGFLWVRKAGSRD